MPENVTFVSEGLVTPANVFRWEKFSSYAKVIGIMAYVMRVQSKTQTLPNYGQKFAGSVLDEHRSAKSTVPSPRRILPDIRKQLLEN